MSTRRDCYRLLLRAAEKQYDRREAEQIARWIVTRRGGCSLNELLVDPLHALRIDGLERIAAELEAGRPVQYILGQTEFCGITLSVGEGVLIPRPETEELVEWMAGTCLPGTTILDVGTGSGCIAIALARRIAGARLYAADLSETALARARRNAADAKAAIDFRRADALRTVHRPETALRPENPESGELESLEKTFDGIRFDHIVSNPPYVPSSDRPTLHTNVRDYEPGEALFVPDGDPLLFYRAIARAGRKLLQPKGLLWFEIYERHADRLLTLLGAEGYDEIRLRNDLNDKPRMICCRIR